MAKTNRTMPGGRRSLRAAHRLLKALRCNKVVQTVDREDVAHTLRFFPESVLARALPRIAEVASWEKDPHVQTSLIMAIGASGRSVKTAPAALTALIALKPHTVDDTATMYIKDALTEIRLINHVMDARPASAAKLPASFQPAA